MEVVTNEWLRADLCKPWKNREVLCRFSDGQKEVCSHNGVYWRDQKGRRIEETVASHVTHFYIFERFV